jgi:hypothetical protein
VAAARMALLVPKGINFFPDSSEKVQPPWHLFSNTFLHMTCIYGFITSITNTKIPNERDGLLDMQDAQECPNLWHLLRPVLCCMGWVSNFLKTQHMGWPVMTIFL